MSGWRKCHILKTFRLGNGVEWRHAGMMVVCQEPFGFGREKLYNLEKKSPSLNEKTKKSRSTYTGRRLAMIRGIGIDILEIDRMKKIMEKDGRFIERIFTSAEIQYCSAKAKKEQHFAARFTAKEAFFKALGLGWRNGMAWKDVCVENDRMGKPEIKIDGVTRDFFRKESYRKIHLSVSHSRQYAVSMVIIE